MSDAEELTSPPPARDKTPPPAVHDCVKSDALLRGKEKIAIRHNNEIYILRQTRFGKLILTK